MPTAKVTSKGQITIPIEVRKALKLKAGDKVDFYETGDGQFAFRPKTGSIMEMKGILRKMGYAPLGHAPTIEEMDEAVLDAVAEDYLRSVGESETSAAKSSTVREKAS
jgi:AbrB family looped-hinge helix DNA binding protein